MNEDIGDGYYLVKCENIDKEPVIAEHCNGDWFFCGFQKAYTGNEVEIISEVIKEVKR